MSKAKLPGMPRIKRLLAKFIAWDFNRDIPMQIIYETSSVDSLLRKAEETLLLMRKMGHSNTEDKIILLIRLLVMALLMQEIDYPKANKQKELLIDAEEV